MQGIIKKKIGNVMYAVYVPHLGCDVTRHIDQIRKRYDSPPTNDQNWDAELVPDVTSLAATRTVPVAQPVAEEGPEPSLVQGVTSPATPVTPRGTLAASLPQRRMAITPIFSTPSVDQFRDSDSEELIDKSIAM